MSELKMTYKWKFVFILLSSLICLSEKEANKSFVTLTDPYYKMEYGEGEISVLTTVSWKRRGWFWGMRLTYSRSKYYIAI